MTRTLPMSRGQFCGDYRVSLRPGEGYQAIINQLTNVLIGAIGSLRTTGNTDEARLVVAQAYEVLLDYDDDVAEHVRWLGREDESKEATLTERSEKCWPIVWPSGNLGLLYR